MILDYNSVQHTMRPKYRWVIMLERRWFIVYSILSSKNGPAVRGNNYNQAGQRFSGSQKGGLLPFITTSSVAPYL